MPVVFGSIPKEAYFDAFEGMGEGRLNGVPRATISFRFTNASDPGISDTAEISIFDPDGWQVLNISGP